MSIICLAHVMRTSKAKLGARLTVFVLAEHAHDDGSRAFPSIETLMERTLLSRRGVQEALRRLETEGEIVKTGVTKTGTNVYRVVLQGGADSARGGADSDVEGAQFATSRGAASAPDPSMTLQGDPAEKDRAAREHPLFGEWIGHHHSVTSIPVPRAGTQARRKIEGMFRARSEEGLSLDELKAATVGAFADEFRRANGYYDPESVLRPTKVRRLVMMGLQASEAKAAETVDWSRFDG